MGTTEGCLNRAEVNRRGVKEEGELLGKFCEFWGDGSASESIFITSGTGKEFRNTLGANMESCFMFELRRFFVFNFFILFTDSFVIKEIESF